MQPDFPRLSPPPSAALVLPLAALILAVRTARFEDREFNGQHSPRFMAQVSNALAAANTLYLRARDHHPEWF